MAHSSNPISLSAPAKINLTLAILGRRPDGYHEIESWIAKIDWCDRLTIASSSELSLTLQGDGQGVPADDSNLVLRAAQAMAAEAGHPPDAAITLDKRIPVGAGLGGGSSDAAAAFMGLNQLWSLGWTTPRLSEVAARIGSDVPLFVGEAPAAVIRGRGERVEALANSWKGWLVIVVPAYPLSTVKVYAAYSPGRSRRSSSPPWEKTPCNALQLQDLLFNDLELAAWAVEPRLAELHAALDGHLGRRIRMTGSGSALFAVFDARDEAEDWRRSAESRAVQPVRMEVVSVL